jgi:hypothetical protein
MEIYTSLLDIPQPSGSRWESTPHLQRLALMLEEEEEEEEEEE